MGSTDRSESILLDELMTGGDSTILKQKRESLMRERDSTQAKIDASNIEVQPMSIQDATLRLVGDLMKFTANIRPVLHHIERIEITDRDQVTATMFGWEIELDLSDWDKTLVPDEEFTYFTPANQFSPAMLELIGIDTSLLNIE